MEVRLKELESEIRELGELADKAVDEVKDDYRHQIEEFFLKKQKYRIRSASFKGSAVMSGKI